MKEEQIISISTRKILGVLVAKGLLRSNFPANGTAKLTVKDFLLAADEVEPRVLPVLPAAILRFPMAFIDRPNFPKPLPEIIAAILKGKKTDQIYFTFLMRNSKDGPMLN